MSDRSDYLPKIHYESLATHETTYWWHVTRINLAEKVIKEHLPIPSDLNVLDYGCGTGGFLSEMNNRLKFKSCCGVDASQQAISYARKYGDFYARLEPGDVAVAANKDLIFLLDVLEHIEDDEIFLGNLIEALKTNAHILVTVPAHPFLFSKWDRVLNHYRRYTRKSFSELVNKTGGRILYMNYCLSYLVPPVLFIRVFRKRQFDSDNCEFPPINPALNRMLLLLNRAEIFLESFFSIPMGSTLIALIVK